MAGNESAAGREPQAARVVRLHAKPNPGGPPRQSPDRVPTLGKQFHAPVRFENIRGNYGVTRQFEAPAVYWGRDGSCWAFLHDFTTQAQARLMDEWRKAVANRRMPHGC
ncbi:hypothetical protein SUTH_01583 [Sulfuritalea hydrogenivorans sk43H]|uniref:Uncharacterized protein n=1 Tax=Sulfuritalea hydrogenivorans sk43H TaxID=1223802 RepID=W0SEB5_9PROT|nr:hypothetical protein SUTH_01583 [Sulfuritalea hydrogenivorans sk43H]